MSARGLTIVFVAGWAVAFAGSFLAFWLTPARDFGLSAGWNKVGVFMGWQAAAAVLAVLAAIASRRVEPGRRMRRMGLIPMGISLGLVAAVVALVAVLNMTKPAPETEPPRPVTAPAATVDG